MSEVEKGPSELGVNSGKIIVRRGGIFYRAIQRRLSVSQNRSPALYSRQSVSRVGGKFGNVSIRGRTVEPVYGFYLLHLTDIPFFFFFVSSFNLYNYC